MMMVVTGVMVYAQAYATDGTWTATGVSAGTWKDPLNWLSGNIAGGGGIATFNQSSAITITNDVSGPLVLSKLDARFVTASADYVTDIFGGTVQLVPPAIISSQAPDNRGQLSFRNTLIDGGDITFTGFGIILLGTNNLYSGRTIVSGGYLRARDDLAFGPVPQPLLADDIILDNGTLMNEDNNVILTLHANRGITLTANGGYLGAGYNNAGIQINGPITGPGALGINFQNCPAILANPNNGYAGDTILGTTAVGSDDFTAKLKLGANDVIPNGPGKGSLIFKSGASNRAPFLDLNGFEATVNGLTSTNRAVIASSVQGQGKLTVLSGFAFDGKVQDGATLRAEDGISVEKAVIAQGTVEVSSGDVTFGGLTFYPEGTLVFDGGNAVLTNQPGILEYQGYLPFGTTMDLTQPLTLNGWKAAPEQLYVNAGGYPLNTQYSYKGMWYAPVTDTYSFAGRFDDGFYLKIGDQVVLDRNNNTQVNVRDIALTQGWYPIDLRCGNVGGSGGKTASWPSGVIYSTDNLDFSDGNNVPLGKGFGIGDDKMLPIQDDCHPIFGRMLMSENGTITVSPDIVGEPIFSGIVQSLGNHALTFSGLNGDLLFGSQNPLYPAVLDGDITNDLILTNYVWLCRLPSPLTIAPGATLAFDGIACPDTVSGDLSLSGYSLQMLDTTLGIDSVTVNTGAELSFKSRVYDNGFFVENPAAFATDITLNGGTVNFDVTEPMLFDGMFSGGGTVNKNGNGALTLDGSTSGFASTFNLNAGRLVLADAAAIDGAGIYLNGGRLCNVDNLSISNPIWALSGGGGFDVLSGTTFEVNGPVIRTSGDISKWGDGTLRLSGNDDNENLQVHVRAGTLELNKSSGYAVRNIGDIMSGTTVIITGSSGNQVADFGYIQTSGGTFDLNGHNETVGTITDTAAGGTIINNGNQPATLTVGYGNASATYANGALHDGDGGLALTKIGTGTQTLGSDALQYSGATTVDNGTLCILPDDNITSSLFRLTLIAPRPTGAYTGTGIQIGEFQLTFKGNGLLWPPLNQLSATGPITNSTQGPDKAVDNTLGGNNKWYVNSNNATLPYVLTVECDNPITFDGYRIGTGNDAEGRDPISWTVEVGVVEGSVTNWVLVDTQTDYPTTTSRNAYTPIFPIHALENTAIPEGAPVVINAGGTLLLPGFAAGQTLAGLTGSGTLKLENSTVILPNPETFTGKVAGSDSTVIFDGTAPEIAIVPLGVNVTFINNGLPATVMNDGTGSGIWCGNIQDGTAPLGLTQTGGTTYYAAPNCTYTGDTILSGGEAIVASAVPVRYVRFTPLVMRPGGDNAGANRYQLSRFRLMSAGQEILYPVGTTAYGELGSNPGGEQASNVLLPADPPYNTNTNTKFYWNGGAQPNPLVIVLPYEMLIDGFTYYTGNDSTGRDPVKWTVEVSVDGAVWTLVDSRDVDPDSITKTRNAKAGEWRFNMLSSDFCVFSPNSQMTIETSAKLSIISATEPVGPLSGDGLIALSKGTLILSTFTDANFAGTIEGDGVLIKQGEAVQTFSGALSYTGDLIVEEGILNLDGAVLTGVTNIILRGGVLTGSATVNGDLTVTCEGGIYDASLNVSGALTVDGEVLLWLPEGAQLPHRRQLFTFQSADPTTLTALENALMTTPLSNGITARVRIEGGSVVLTVSRVGTILILK